MANLWQACPEVVAWKIKRSCKIPLRKVYEFMTYKFEIRLKIFSCLLTLYTCSSWVPACKFPQKRQEFFILACQCSIFCRRFKWWSSSWTDYSETMNSCAATSTTCVSTVFCFIWHDKPKPGVFSCFVDIPWKISSHAMHTVANKVWHRSSHCWIFRCDILECFTTDSDVSLNQFWICMQPFNFSYLYSHENQLISIWFHLESIWTRLWWMILLIDVTLFQMSVHR